VIGIFIIFVTLLWVFKRKSYQGPVFDMAAISSSPQPVATTMGLTSKHF